MSVDNPGYYEMVIDRLESFENLIALVSEGDKLTAKEHKALVDQFTELLQPYGIPPTPLHEVLREAAKKAGWQPLSAKVEVRQQTAARARVIQREHDLAHRRVLVAIVFKKLPRRLREKPSSLGTAQAIIRRLDELPFERKPPMTVRTIQQDIFFMRKNANFGI